MLATMQGPDFPIAVGVLYREEKASFVDDSRAQVIDAREGLLAGLAPQRAHLDGRVDRAIQ
jgi:hypothetical protein